MATADTGNHASTTNSLFSSLLEQSRKLRQETDSADLPSIQLGLGEIERRARELKKSSSGRPADARARYFLQAGGINTDENLRDLDSIDFQTAYEPSVPVDTDINAYLRSRKDQNVASSIEDGMRRTARDFDSFVAKNVTMEWDAQKMRIFEHFGLAPKLSQGQEAAEQSFSGGLSAFGKSSFGRSRLGASVNQKGPGLSTNSVWAKSGMGSSVLGKSVSRPSEAPGSAQQSNLFSDVDNTRQFELSRPQQQRQHGYGQVVRQMNATRLSSDAGAGSFPVMNTFADITAASGSDMLTVQLTDSWKLLASITGESKSDRGGPREREFYRDYIISTAPDGPEASRIRKRIEHGSRRFLENHFMGVVEKTVTENPQIARIGGIPTVVNKFRGFVNVKMAHNRDLADWDDKNFDKIGEVPCWALVFYLMRAGLVKEADAWVRTNQQAFQKLDRGFATYLHAYCSNEDRRLPRALHDRIQGEYNNRVRHKEDSKDPFKPVVYKIIGRCDLTKRSEATVMPTAEDWMWLQLVLSREIDRTSEPAHEVFTIQDLQSNIVQFGAKHFAARSANVGLYFQMLLSCGLFEEAVAYLYSFHFVDGVHFAIALTYYGLLRPSENPAKAEQELTTYGTHREKQINFPRMIGYYTRDFRTPNVEEAVDYLSLICLNGDLPAPVGSNQLHVCHEALRALVLETREFTKLLGDVRADGTRERGAIETRLKLVKLSDQSEFLRTITEQAASQADEDGRASDAVLLYHLAEDYDTVVQILNKNLSDSIALEENVMAHQGFEGAVPGSSMSLASVDDPMQLARNMLGMYTENANIIRKISLKHREACGVLLQIGEAKKKFAEGRWESCLTIIDRVDVIPLDPRSDVGNIRRRSQNFGSLHETVARNVGILLKMAVECCQKLSVELRDSQYADASKTHKLTELKMRTKSAMMYAGMIQYKLPAHVYAFLTRHDMSG
ncbi:Nup93/Nic96-domain-containing protein [Geopyxis carbonaria]|nr:Nup93/Nic96-domain-containing protein [Geopyxis carbonaria]